MDEFSEQNKVQYCTKFMSVNGTGSQVTTGFLPAERAFLKNGIFHSIGLRRLPGTHTPGVTIPCFQRAKSPPLAL